MFPHIWSSCLQCSKGVYNHFLMLQFRSVRCIVFHIRLIYHLSITPHMLSCHYHNIKLLFLTSDSIPILHNIFRLSYNKMFQNHASHYLLYNLRIFLKVKLSLCIKNDLDFGWLSFSLKNRCKLELAGFIYLIN